MITSPLERGKGVCYKTIFVDDCHTPLPLSRGDLIKSKQILKSLHLRVSMFQNSLFPQQR
jgi:hypothetical protein